jgi:cholesterol transport system auxiliary component
MRHFIVLLISSLIVSSMVACVGTNKARQDLVIYDFGLPVSSENGQQITSKILFEAPLAAESLNHNQIRYRLNYQNPSRIFFYTERRWILNVAQNPLNCSLKLKIEAFDHVFQTATASTGVVQLSALLVDKKSRKIISSQLISESIASSSPNAQGGTAALNQASEVALKKAINWGNLIAESSALCQ